MVTCSLAHAEQSIEEREQSRVEQSRLADLQTGAFKNLFGHNSFMAMKVRRYGLWLISLLAVFDLGFGFLHIYSRYCCRCCWHKLELWHFVCISNSNHWNNFVNVENKRNQLICNTVRFFFFFLVFYKDYFK